MKITPEHYAILETALLETTTLKPSYSREAYTRAGLSDTRFVWDVLHATLIDGEPSYRFVCDTLYPAGLNDSHITTALKRILL